VPGGNRGSPSEKSNLRRSRDLPDGRKEKTGEAKGKDGQGIGQGGSLNPFGGNLNRGPRKRIGTRVDQGARWGNLRRVRCGFKRKSESIKGVTKGKVPVRWQKQLWGNKSVGGTVGGGPGGATCRGEEGCFHSETEKIKATGTPSDAEVPFLYKKKKTEIAGPKMAAENRPKDGGGITKKFLGTTTLIRRGKLKLT